MIVIGKVTTVGKVELSTPTGVPTVTVDPFAPVTTRDAAVRVDKLTGLLNVTVIDVGEAAMVAPEPGDTDETCRAEMLAKAAVAFASP